MTEHNPGEPDFGHDETDEHNPGEPSFGGDEGGGEEGGDAGGPDTADLDADPAYNPDDGGLKDLKGG